MPSRPKNMKVGPGAPVHRKSWQTVSDASAQRIRGRRGQSIRERFLALHPLCVECTKEQRVTVAVIVDHRTPLAEGGMDTDDNRQSLCKRHHDVKSAAEAARGRARGRGQTSAPSRGHR